MMRDVILPWFPIILSAAVGARLVGRGRSAWLGVTCALYFVVVVQLTTGTPFWSDMGTAAALLAGSASIVGMAEWSGRREGLVLRDGADGSGIGGAGSAESRGALALRSVSGAIEAFDEWLESNRHSVDAWARFEEFVRHTLHAYCGAALVRPYRILAEGEGMVPLRAVEGPECVALTSARRGIVGHVATSGRSYYAGDAAQGALVAALADRSSDSPQWCFAVRQGPRKIGLVSVASVHGQAPTRETLEPWERLISQFWITLTEMCRGRSAATTDAVSQLLIRESFLAEAERGATESYARGEPVALCVIAAEGLRTLTDQGCWGLANEVVEELGRTLRERVRPDDVLGRFDDSRFLLLLRRVDSELASLISAQLIDRLSELPVVRSLPGDEIGIRCGLAGSGTESQKVAQLVEKALRLCREARSTGVRVKSDVRDPEESLVTAEASAESLS